MSCRIVLWSWCADHCWSPRGAAVHGHHLSGRGLAVVVSWYHVLFAGDLTDIAFLDQVTGARRTFHGQARSMVGVDRPAQADSVVPQPGGAMVGLASQPLIAFVCSLTSKYQRSKRRNAVVLHSTNLAHLTPTRVVDKW